MFTVSDGWRYVLLTHTGVFSLFLYSDNNG